MSNLRQVVIDKGVAKMGGTGVFHHKNLVEAMAEHKKLVKYNLPNHTMVLHSYGCRKESDDSDGDDDDEPSKLSGDFSASIQRARNEVARAVGTWNK